MHRHLLMRSYLRKGEAYHFAKMELGQIQKANLHDHDFSELFWIESGDGLHWIEGERRTIGPATLVFVRPSDLHNVGTATSEKKMVICNLAFPTRAWRALAKRLSGTAHWFRRGEPGKREHAVSPAAFDFLRRAGLEMAFAPRSQLMLERFFLNLWVALQANDPSPELRTPDWLHAAVTRVERDGLFREGVAALTRLSGRSQEHVVRESHRWLHKTPTILINEMRMRHAAALLSTTQRKIVDISLDCGFENLGHFYMLFQESQGMTPRRYRLIHQSILRPV